MVQGCGSHIKLEYLLSGDQVGKASSRQGIEGWAQQAGTTADGQVPAQTWISEFSRLIGRFPGGAGMRRPE